jgi:hypothetical protein
MWIIQKRKMNILFVKYVDIQYIHKRFSITKKKKNVNFVNYYAKLLKYVVIAPFVLFAIIFVIL